MYLFKILAKLFIFNLKRAVYSWMPFLIKAKEMDDNKSYYYMNIICGSLTPRRATFVALHSTKFGQPCNRPMKIVKIESE